MEQKKTYAPPAVTEHGNVIERTTGFGGRIWEMLNPKPNPDIEPDEIDLA